MLKKKYYWSKFLQAKIISVFLLFVPICEMY